MRMLLHVDFPLEPFNTMVRNGTVGAKIRNILEAIKPEAAYFSEYDGHRGATIVVNATDALEIPALAEPFLLTFNATTRFRIAMTPEDLGKAGLDTLGKTWS